MSKQNKQSKLNKNPLHELDWIKNQVEIELPAKYKVKTSEKGCIDSYTRATFIMRKDILLKLKNYAYTERMEIKEAINNIVEEFLKDKEVIEKYTK
jgi:hypothetical protein